MNIPWHRLHDSCTVTRNTWGRAADGSMTITNSATAYSGPCRIEDQSGFEASRSHALTGKRLVDVYFPARTLGGDAVVVKPSDGITVTRRNGTVSALSPLFISVDAASESVLLIATCEEVRRE